MEKPKTPKATPKNFKNLPTMNSPIPRRRTHAVSIGGLTLGGSNPVRLQSMTTTDTNDIRGSVGQCLRIVASGADLIRLTTQGLREVESLRQIRDALRAEGCQVPLVADVHFNPAVADAAAAVCEKVRINPGNYVDPTHTFQHIDYTDAEYAAELQRLDERFCRLLRLCCEHGTHRREPRLAVRPHHVALRRYARRHC